MKNFLRTVAEWLLCKAGWGYEIFDEPDQEEIDRMAEGFNMRPTGRGNCIYTTIDKIDEAMKVCKPGGGQLYIIQDGDDSLVTHTERSY